MAAALAIVQPDGTAMAGPTGLDFPNGTVITPDGATLIVGETFGSRMTAFPILEGGLLGSPRGWAEAPGVYPGGCCLDEAGGIWVADAGGGDVIRILEGGEITDRIPMPDLGRSQKAYACMLGGDDGRILHCITAPSAREINTAGVGGGAIWTVRVEYPRAGLP
ncbi:MAG: hypothetical protein Ct9H300mP12_11510 [Acidimicrobiales bacterium]|nr:MAG: hypothetical protein Ct9H300mP12_11510 [Acidimicrobiales bacterium]